VDDMVELLGPDWDWFGVGRDDGGERGEYSPIFFKRSKFDALSKDSFWLSGTPFKPSKYPNAGSYRVCSSMILRDKITGRLFNVLNTHLDDRSDEQRRLGAALILHRARFEAEIGQHTVLILGDFNSSQSGRDSGAYQIVTGLVNGPPLPADFLSAFPVSGDAPAFKMVDVKAEVPRQFVSGHYATYTGFSSPRSSSTFARIDFIFGGSNGGWKGETYHVGNSLTDDGMWTSDHRPVFCDIKLYG